MAKISDTSSYPSITPAAGDYLVLTDVSDSNSTKTVTMQSIADFIGGGGASIQAGDGIDIDFGTTPSTISANLKTDGGVVFESAELALDLGASSITGTLTVGNGGTGAATLTGLIVGNGTSAFTERGDINDLYTAKFDTAVGGSLYFGNIPSAAPSTGDNIFIGGGSGSNITNVSGSNTIVGSKSVTALTSGGANVVIGTQAGIVLQTGEENTIVGRRADVVAQGDDHVVAVGSGAAATLDGTAVGAASSSLRDGVAIGYESNAGRDGIAIGSGAEALANTISIASATHSLTLNPTSRTADTFLPIMINGTQYYIQLYVA